MILLKVATVIGLTLQTNFCPPLYVLFPSPPSLFPLLLSLRRQKARERQQKLLAEFASRQKSFMETAMDVGKFLHGWLLASFCCCRYCCCCWSVGCFLVFRFYFHVSIKVFTQTVKKPQTNKKPNTNPRQKPLPSDSTTVFTCSLNT